MDLTEDSDDARAGVDDERSAKMRRSGAPSASVLEQPPAACTETTGIGPLNAAELAAFERDGFLLLRGVVPQPECERFLWKAVVPALARVGISPFDEATWHDGFGDTDGARVRTPAGGAHPIPLSDPDSRWLALRGSRRLLGALSQLHGGAARWRWTAGAASGERQHQNTLANVANTPTLKPCL